MIRYFTLGSLEIEREWSVFGEIKYKLAMNHQKIKWYLLNKFSISFDGLGVQLIQFLI